MIRAIWKTTKKELYSLVNNPAIYIVFVLALVLWEFLFFQGFLLSGEASVRGMFELLPWILLFVAPALTMGLYSNEKSLGTFETLFTYPVSEWSIVIGKLKGVGIVFSTMLIAPLGVVMLTGSAGDFDGGAVFVQLIAAVLLFTLFAALGAFFSSLFKNQIVSFISTAFVSLGLILIGTDLVLQSVSGVLSSVLQNFSVLVHYQSLLRGVLDLRDIWYFVSITGALLFGTYFMILRDRIGNLKSKFRGYQVVTALVVIIALLSSLLSNFIPGRIDMTEQHIYTLSPATNNILTSLDDIVTITTYQSEQLPAQVQPTVRDLRDTLRDYSITGGSQVQVVYKMVTDEESQQEAAAAGVQAIQFNVVGDQQYQIQQGFLGLQIAYAARTEVIPFVSSVNDLEFQLSSRIAKLTNTSKTQIGFLSAPTQRVSIGDFRVVQSETQGLYEFTTVAIPSPDAEDQSNPLDEINTLVLAGLDQALEPHVENAVIDFAKSGGNILVLQDSVVVDQSTIQAQTIEPSPLAFLSDWGVSIQPNLVFDTFSSESVALSGGLFQILVPYAFWPQLVPHSEDHAVSSRLQTVSAAWASGLVLSDTLPNNTTAHTLFGTTEGGATQEQSFAISPTTETAPPGVPGVSEVVVALEGQFAGGEQSGRLIVVGDVEMLTDGMMQNSPDNLAFASAALDWLSDTDGLSSIRAKTISRPLLFENESGVSRVENGSFAIAVLVPLFAGAFVVVRRKRLKNTVGQYK